MTCLKLKKVDVKTLVLAMIVLSIVDRGRCIRRQCHVQSEKQTYLELACDTLGLDYSADYFYMDVPTHGPINHIQDSTVPAHNFIGKSNDTLPPGFLVDQSSIEFAGLGVFTLKDLPLLTMIGPYDGVFVPMTNENESTLVYAWEIEHDGAYHHLVDAQDETRANWLRYINSPITEAGANMKAYQAKGQMMYRTLKHIPPCTELLVWYGDNYGQYLDDLREERETGSEEEDEEKGEDALNDNEDEGAESEIQYDEEDDFKSEFGNDDEEQEEEDENDSEDEAAEGEADFDEDDGVSGVDYEEEEQEEADENASEDEGTRVETEYNEEDLSDVDDEETNSNDSDSYDTDNTNGNENRNEKGVFVNNDDENVETKIDNRHKDIKNTKITCDATKPDGDDCMKPESNIYTNVNGNEDL